MRLTTSSDGKNINEPQILPTPQNYPEALSIIKNHAFILSEGEKIKLSAGGVAGVFNLEKSKLFYSPNLPLWVNQSIKEDLEKIFGSKVLLENDAALAGLGEATHGVESKKKIIAYLTIGTGVGGVRIVDGKIDCSNFGFEPGHQIINFYDNTLRDLESYISGPAIKKIYLQEAMDIKNKLVWEEIAQRLSIGLCNLILFWSPEVIIIGGSVAKSLPLELIEGNLKRTLNFFPTLPEISLAKFGDLSGIYGALEYIKSFSNP